VRGTINKKKERDWMKRYLLVACIIAATLCTSQTANANVFAAHLTSSVTGGGYALKYRLNEPASTVVIQIRGPEPATDVVRTLAGGTSEGLNSVLWDAKDESSIDVPTGNYDWVVTATDPVGHVARYDRLNNDNDTTSKYFHGCGVVANTNQDSDYFGCVYVSESEGGTVDGRITSQGIFLLNNDLTPYTVQGDSGYDGNLVWSTAKWFSPMRVRLDEEDNVIITDWSNSHSGIWKAPPHCRGTFAPVLTENGRSVSGRCDNHGSIMAAWVEGSGSSRVIYTIDEDYTVGLETTGSILKYDVGDALSYSATPEVIYNDAIFGNKIVNSRVQHVKDDTGWWITQYRPSQEFEPWLIHWNRGAIDFDSKSAGLGIQPSYGALAIDPAGDRLLIGQVGYISLLDISGMPTTVAIEGTIPSGGDDVQDVGFDAAGNFFQINSSLKRLRYYSPDDGPNSFATTCPSSQTIQLGSLSTGIENRTWNAYE